MVRSQQGETPKTHQFPCGQCGAELTYQPGSKVQECAYCGHQNLIESSAEPIRELDFDAYADALRQVEAEGRAADVVEGQMVHCETCGADISLDPHTTADACAYCGSNVVVRESKRLIKPRALVPFAVPKKQARQLFRKWISSRFFAPSDLAKQARSSAGVQGIYVPYWTYDSDTTTYYRGERGEDYYVTETYTERVNGENVRRTRRVRRTRWYSVQGVVRRFFDDVLILASKTLPEKYTERLEPWDLKSLTGYDEQFLSGFRAEKYQIALEQGFETAHQKMENWLREDVCRDIGGDRQRIHGMKVQHHKVRFKHILLPIWISAYRYRQKVYRFLVNGQTGEVQGERPLSWIKITLAALAGIGAVAAIVYFTRG